MGTDRIVAIDWGSTNFRTWLMSGEGTVLGSVSEGRGLTSVAGDGFAAAIDEICGDWLADHPAAPVILGGMVGCRGGWREVPYAPCPVTMNDIAGQADTFELSGHPAPSCPAPAMRGRMAAT